MTPAGLTGLRSGRNDIVIDGRGNICVKRVGLDMLASAALAYVAYVGPGRFGTGRGRGQRVSQGNGRDAGQSTLIADSYRKSSWGTTSRPTVVSPTGSASIPRTPSGTPICQPALRARADRACRPSELHRGGFACGLGGDDRSALFIVAAE